MTIPVKERKLGSNCIIIKHLKDKKEPKFLKIKYQNGSLSITYII